MIPTKADIKIESLKRKDGKELLKEYENLEPEKEFIIECYRRAIIEKYANEIDY